MGSYYMKVKRQSLKIWANDKNSVENYCTFFEMAYRNIYLMDQKNCTVRGSGLYY